MSSAWRMTPSVTDACRSERLHYRLRPALGDRDLSSRHRGLFEALDRETDPVLIAQQADKRPVFPSLEAADNGVTGAATSAESEPAVIGIMDPQAREYRPPGRLLGDQHRVRFTVESLEKAAMSAR
jgi:hypothetical protein